MSIIPNQNKYNNQTLKGKMKKEKVEVVIVGCSHCRKITATFINLKGEKKISPMVKASNGLKVHACCKDAYEAKIKQTEKYNYQLKEVKGKNNEK